MSFILALRSLPKDVLAQRRSAMMLVTFAASFVGALSVVVLLLY